MTVEDVLEFLEEHREHNVLRSGITLGSIRDYMGRCMDSKVDAQLKISALTARAESAEAERDAAVADIESIMSLRGLKDFAMCGYCARPDDDTCFIPKNDEKCKARWRGLPQDGGAE